MTEPTPSRKNTTTLRLQPEQMNAEFLSNKLGLWLRVAHRDVVQHVNEVFARYDLVQAEFLILGLVRDNPGCRQISIACALEIGPPNLARIMEILAERDLIVRSPDPLDKRVNRINLTTEGERCLSEAEVDYLRIQEGLLSRLGPSAGAPLLYALKCLAEAHFARGTLPDAGPLAHEATPRAPGESLADMTLIADSSR